MLELPYSVKVLQQQPTDSKVGPFFTVAQALLENVPGIRVQGLLTVVITAGKPSLYWFKDGIADSDFVPYVINDAYSSALAFESDRSISGSLFYNTIQAIGYVPGNIAYQNVVGGDDSTAMLGNSLKPFKTIGAAIAAIGLLPNSAIYCSAGYNYMDDSNAPYGLKMPGSYYDLLFDAGSTVDYYGTYGLYISDYNTFGNIYGKGVLIANGSVYSGSIDGVGNYAFNISAYTTPKYIEVYDLKRESSSTSGNLLRIGTCYQTGMNFNIAGRIQDRGGWCITADANSRTYFERINYLVNPSDLCGLIRIINPATFALNNLLQSAAFGNYVAKNQTRAIIITDTTGNSSIAFDNCKIIASETTNVNYALIEIIPPVSGLLPNLSFKNCVLKNKQVAGFSSTGVGFLSAANASFKIIDTYSEKNLGGTGIISNLISSGNGLMVEPNI